MFAEIGRWRMKCTTLTTVYPQSCTSDGINGNTGRVGEVLHRKGEFQVHGHVTEEPTFHANNTGFVVFLPRHIITGTNMDVFIAQTPGGYGLNSLCLGYFLGGKATAAEHVEEIGVATGIELISTLQLDATFLEQIGQRAVNDGCAHLGLDVITDDGDYYPVNICNSGDQ